MLSARFLAPGAQAAQAQGFQTIAPTAILMDAESHAVLFEKNADELTAPASMAKTMTAEVVFNEIKNGRLNFDSEFMISENAWRKGGGGSGGSAMFAKVNTTVRLEDLLRGLIVQSGNDAAIAIAEGIAGTEENFARMMNERAKQIGLTKSTFRNATGYGHPEQKVTVRELAKLALYVIETYPDLYKMFGEREFTWNKIRQQNRNPLLFLDIGADGLKTGNIDEAGYRPDRVRCPERSAPDRRRERAEDAPRTGRRNPASSWIGASGPSNPSSSSRRDRSSARLRFSVGTGGRCRLCPRSLFVYLFPVATASGSRLASSIPVR